MTIHINIQWIDSFISALKKSGHKIKNIDDHYEIEEIFNPVFMSKYTQFSSIEQMLAKSWFVIVEQDDLEKAADPKFNNFVKKNTTFDCRESMLSFAWKQFIKDRMIDL